MDINIYLENRKSIQGDRLKKLLLKAGLMTKQCNICKRTDWLNKPLAFHLHHNDGNNKNNNLSNLQLLCPNCHSQTPNYAGKNKKKITKVKTIVSENTIIEAIKTSFSRRQALLKVGLCGKGGNYQRINEIINLHNVQFLERPISEKERKYREKRIQTIKNKYGTIQNSFQNKIEWPTKDELEIMLKNKSCLSVAKDLGVSNSAIRKKAKQYGLNMKAISPWAVKHGNTSGGTRTHKLV